MVFGNGVKNIQAAAYNGARTVDAFFFIYFAFKYVKLLIYRSIWFNLRNIKNNQALINFYASVTFR